MDDASPDTKHRFRRRHRLTHAREFQAVFGAKTATRHGPLTIYTLPNDLGWPRLGLSVGRRVGNAVARNAVKRRLREAFRQAAPSAPASLDVVVTVRPHARLKTPAYGALLAEALHKGARRWEKRRDRSAERAGPKEPSP